MAAEKAAPAEEVAAQKAAKKAAAAKAASAAAMAVAEKAVAEKAAVEKALEKIRKGCTELDLDRACSGAPTPPRGTAARAHERGACGAVP